MRADFGNNGLRQGNVIQVLSSLVSVLECPVEELQRFLTLVRLLLRGVQQYKGSADNRPRILARFIRQDLVERLRPVGASSGGLERFCLWLNLASLALNLFRSLFKLFCVLRLGLSRCERVACF